MNDKNRVICDLIVCISQTILFICFYAFAPFSLYHYIICHFKFYKIHQPNQLHTHNLQSSTKSTKFFLPVLHDSLLIVFGPALTPVCKRSFGVNHVRDLRSLLGAALSHPHNRRRHTITSDGIVAYRLVCGSQQMDAVIAKTMNLHCLHC